MSEPVMAHAIQGARRGRAVATALATGALLALAMGLLADTVEAAQGDDTTKTLYSQTSAKAERSLLIDIAKAGTRLVAVGDRGHILFSDDQGNSWSQARVPTRQLLTAVYFIDAKHGWAVGHDAQILASDDGGATWSKQFEDLQREAPLLDVWFQSAEHGIAVGAYGAILETTDGGQHWNDISERLDNPDQLHLNGIAAVKDAGLFVVGEQGSLFRSGDFGQTWEKLQSPYEGTFFGVIGTAQANTLLAYGLRGNLYRSSDFGSNWQQVPLQGVRGPLEFGLAGATLLDDGSLVLVGNGGTVLRSGDDGVSFSVVNRADRLALSAVTAVADGNLIVVGQGGEHAATATGAERAQP